MYIRAVPFGDRFVSRIRISARTRIGGCEWRSVSWPCTGRLFVCDGIGYGRRGVYTGVENFSLLEFENGCIGSNNELSTDNAGKATFPFRFSSLVVSLCFRITFLKRPPGLHLMDFSFLVSRHERERERETFPRLIKISFYIFRDSFPSRSLSPLNRAFPFEESKSRTPLFTMSKHIFPRCFASGSHVGWKMAESLFRTLSKCFERYVFLRDNNIWRL